MDFWNRRLAVELCAGKRSSGGNLYRIFLIDMTQMESGKRSFVCGKYRTDIQVSRMEMEDLFQIGRNPTSEKQRP